MGKIFLIRETKTIAGYSDRSEAEADKANRELWYPENEYQIVEEDTDDEEV